MAGRTYGDGRPRLVRRACRRKPDSATRHFEVAEKSYAGHAKNGGGAWKCPPHIAGENVGHAPWESGLVFSEPDTYTSVLETSSPVPAVS